MLNRSQYFIRERVGLMKFVDTYDILDPQTQNQLGIAQENPGKWMHLCRLIISKGILPTKVFVYEGADPKDQTKVLFSIERGMAWFRPQVNIYGKNHELLGWFKGKVFGWGFQVFDTSGVEIAKISGDWKGWNFKFTDSSGKEIGSITKKWAGLGKELFTTADNYMISLTEQSNPIQATLLLAAGLAVDIIYTERK